MSKLIVFYSYTGHTKIIAEKIKNKLGCDMLELQPKDPYSTDYQQVVDDEQNSEASKHIPEIQDINIDFNKYDEIILGYPTWWYRPAPVVRAFVTKYDMTGKTIIPFVTNAGWLGKSFKELEVLCPNSRIENPMNIVFTMDYAENKTKTPMTEIEDWIEKIK